MVFPQSVLRQVHSLLKSEFSMKCHLVLPLTPSSCLQIWADNIKLYLIKNDVHGSHDIYRNNYKPLINFRFLWPCIVNKVWRGRKPTRCNNQMFIINLCLNMFRASLCPSSGEQRPCVTAYGVLSWFCWMWLVAVVGCCVVGCEHCEGYFSKYPAEPAQCTICSNTRSLFSWR